MKPWRLYQCVTKQILQEGCCERNQYNFLAIYICFNMRTGGGADRISVCHIWRWKSLCQYKLGWVLSDRSWNHSLLDEQCWWPDLGAEVFEGSTFICMFSRLLHPIQNIYAIAVFFFFQTLVRKIGLEEKVKFTIEIWFLTLTLYITQTIMAS